VRGIYEQNIVLSKLLKQRRRLKFYTVSDNLNSDLFQPRVFVRLNANVFAFIAILNFRQPLNCHPCDQGALATTDLDDTARLEAPNHVVKHFGVTDAVGCVLVTKSRRMLLLVWNSLQFIAVIELVINARCASTRKSMPGRGRGSSQDLLKSFAMVIGS
jgi:hypothetical protein